jgi:hypothetical protein
MELPIVIDGLTADTEYQFTLGRISTREGHKLNIFGQNIKTRRERKKLTFLLLIIN